ncbi:MAG: sugar phosphate isomerase/epimerase [Glaciecola sp.]|jgi:sugar phosphate isomerase/epimerase
MCTPHASNLRADTSHLLSRRGFLRAGAGTAAVIAATGRLRPASAQESALFCVPQDRISLQLYTMREDMGTDLAGTLQGIHDIGFRQVEHAGYDQTEGGTANDLKAALDTAGLRASSGHRGIPYPFDAAAMEVLIEDALVLGATSIVEPLPNFALAGLVPGIILGQAAPVSPIPGAVWADFAATLNQAGAMAADAGLRVGYHNHNPEFAPLAEGGTGYDVLLAETDPELVHFELDLYWSWAAGQDPVELLEAHPSRFKQFHVKDMDADGAITDPGTGVIDFDRIFAAADANNVPVQEYTIEQDNAGTDSLRTAQRGWELLTGTCAEQDLLQATPPASTSQDADEPAVAPEPSGLPATGGGLVGLGAIGLAGMLALRDRTRL